jgi:hypothetical protein
MDDFDRDLAPQALVASPVHGGHATVPISSRSSYLSSLGNECSCAALSQTSAAAAIRKLLHPHAVRRAPHTDTRAVDHDVTLADLTRPLSIKNWLVFRTWSSTVDVLPTSALGVTPQYSARRRKRALVRSERQDRRGRARLADQPGREARSRSGDDQLGPHLARDGAGSVGDRVGRWCGRVPTGWCEEAAALCLGG